jgi:cation:H+ antiporter
VRRLPLPAPLSHALAGLVGKVHEQASRRGGGRRSSKRSLARLGVYVTGALVLIVVGSMGIVHATLTISADWGISRSLVGGLVLAALTGIPNAYTAVVLGLEKKGTAVVSETLNSNTINIVVGVGLPAVFFGMKGDQEIAILELWWLLGLTAVAVLLPALSRGINRSAGLMIIGLYLTFVTVRVYLQ